MLKGAFAGAALGSLSAAAVVSALFVAMHARAVLFLPVVFLFALAVAAPGSFLLAFPLAALLRRALATEAVGGPLRAVAAVSGILLGLVHALAVLTVAAGEFPPPRFEPVALVPLLVGGIVQGLGTTVALERSR